MTAVANSGPEEPAAIKVAPATSGGKFNTKIKDMYVKFHPKLDSLLHKIHIT